MMKLWDTLQRSRKLNEQLSDILKAERQIGRVPVAGAAERLRNSPLNRRSKERGFL